MEDAQAPMGVATTNVIGRVMASVGALPGGVPLRFEACEDISCGGVLLALPALLACGLLRHSSKYFHLPDGYYTLANIFLLLGLMTLNRVGSIEQLRRCVPGEWGKVLGLDRCPVVETLRRKIKYITKSGQEVENWAAALAQDWMEIESLEQQSGGLLYLVDGHVRVYHGSQTKLPRHYVARQRLCLRAMTDYWVNQSDGAPLFRISQVVDPGMIQVLREQIVPRLKEDIPAQPTQEQLDNDPVVSRFTLVFDREGYSPLFFKEMWEDNRIACQTYRKLPYDDWAIEEFKDTQIRLSNGTMTRWKLAERGVLLGSKKKERLWVREVRKLTDRGHQTAVVSTQFKASMEAIALSQFGRWGQENFFRYARQSFDLDRLIDYQLDAIPDTVEVVNPVWRQLDGEVRREVARLSRRKAQFAGLILQGDIEPDKVEAFVSHKQELQAEIEQSEIRVEDLKSKRKEQTRKVPLADLPEEQRFDQLCNRSKQFIDTIKIIAYRAETAVSQVLREKIQVHHRDEVRGLARQIFQTEANLKPDPKAGTLTVEIHRMSTPRDDLALKHLCTELTETQTKYPGTDLRLIYKLVS